MTLNELSQLFYLNREIEVKQSRIELLKENATNTAVKYSDMPHGSGSSDKIGDNATEIAYLESVIELKKKECVLEEIRLTRYINTIPDSLTRLIFSLRFINGLPWEQVAASIGGNNTDESVKKICYRYLKSYQSKNQ